MKHTTLTLALATSAMLALTGCGGSSDPLDDASDASAGAESADDSVVVGSANFSESVLLAEIYAGALSNAGVDATTNTGIGAREIYIKALQDGSIDVMPEYTGALALYFDKEFDKTDPDEVYAALQEVLPEGLTVLEKSAAEDNDSIVVTRETADEYSLSTLEDLAPVAGDLRLGANPEFQTRPQGIDGLASEYGIEFGGFQPLSGQSLVQALKNGQVDAGNVFSTDPAIAVNDFVALEDTKKLFGSQNVVPLVVADKADLVRDTLNEVSAVLTTEQLIDLLKATDVDKQDPASVAQDFLADNGL